MIKYLFNRYLQFVVRYPRIVLIAIGLMTLAMALGLPNFKLDASSDSLTLEGDRDLDYYRQVAKDYQSGDFLVVTFKPKQDLFSDASLALLASLRDELAHVYGVASVNTILDVPLLYSPKQTIAQILQGPRSLSESNVDRAMAKKEFLDSPVYKDMILGPDGQTTALLLNLKVDDQFISLVRNRDKMRLRKKNNQLDSEEEQVLQTLEETFLAYRTEAQNRNNQQVKKVRDIVARYRDQAQIYVGGVTMVTADMISFIEKDLIVFGVAVIAFMIAILALIFKSFRFVVIPMACCLIAVVIMLGFVSWLDWRLTVISSNFVALLLIVSLSIIIHLIVRYREYALEHSSWTQQELVVATIKFMALPCFYTTTTTIVAFVSLVASGIRPVIDFGWMMSMGLVVALVLAFLIMPASLMFLPREKGKTNKKKNFKQRLPTSMVFSRVVEKRGNIILTVAALVAVLSGVGISRLTVENSFIDYFRESTEIHKGLSVIDNDLGGTTNFEIIIDKPTQQVAVKLIENNAPSVFDEKDDPFAEEDPFGESESFDEEARNDDPFGAEDEDPFGEEKEASPSDDDMSYWLTIAGISQIEEIHDYLESVPEIGKVDSLATMYKIGRDLNNGLNGFELALFGKSLKGDVRDVLISPYISPDGKQARIVMRIHDLYPGLKRTELAKRIESDIYAMGVFKPAEVRFTGLLVLYNNMLQSLFSSQIMTLGVVFLCILLMFIVLFKSFLVAVIAIIPNILASLSILGGMGLAGLPLDMMTITVAGITLGIGVDGTIHYIHRFKAEVLKDGDYIGAMQRSHGSIGRAVLYTSVIIIFGFSIMMLSQFVPTIHFGMLTGFAMFAALMASLLLLPRLVLLVKPFGSLVPEPQLN